MREPATNPGRCRMTSYRIEYTIRKSEDGFERSEEEVGFGSSGTWGDIDACLNIVVADIQNEAWETL